MAGDKNQDIIELVIKGEDEYSEVSEQVRQELGELTDQAKSTRTEFDRLEKSLDLADTYRKQEAEVERLAVAQGEAKVEVDRLTKANKEAEGENVELAASLAKVKAEYASLRTATNRAQKEFDKTKDAVSRYGVDLDEVTENQEQMRVSADRLAGELTDLSKAQNRLVSSAREQVAAAKEQEKAQEASRKELERETKAWQDRINSAAAAVKKEREIGQEKARLTTEISKEISALEKGKITWEDYKRRVSDMGRASALTRQQVAEVSQAIEAQVTAAKSAAESVKKQAAAREVSRKELEKEGQAWKARIEAALKAADKDKEVRQQTERLTTEIRNQISALEKNEISWEDYRRRVSAAGQATDLNRKQISAITSALDEQVIAARKTAEASQKQIAETNRITQATERYRAELALLVDRYREHNVSAEKFEKSEVALRQKLRLTENQVEATRKEMRAYTNQIDLLPEKQDKSGKSTDRLTQVTRRLAQAYTVLVAAQKAADLAIGSGKAYADTENAMLGLQKTSTLTASEIEAVTDEMRRLSGDVTPTTTAELLGVAEAAGRMGVDGVENILAFTKSIDALSSATGIVGSDAAQAIAQILNVTGEAQSNVSGVASVIAELGNTTATTEEQIIHFGKRFAADTKVVGLASHEVLGLAAGMAEMGQQAEGSGSVIGRVFRFIDSAVKGGGEEMQALQDVVGKTSTEIERAFGKDKTALFLDFAAGIGRLQDEGQTMTQILDDMGLKSDENARVLGLLSRNYEGVEKAVKNANGAFEKGDAHFREMAKKAASLTSGVERMKNRLDTLRVAMGEAFADDTVRAMDSMADSGAGMEEAFAEMGEATAEVVELLGDFFGTLGGLSDAISGTNESVGVMDGLFTGLSMNIDLVLASINFLVGGFAELAIVQNEFFGDDEDVERWRKTQEEAFARVDKSVKRYNDNLKKLNGESSRAYADLRDTYEQNRGALDAMDEAQRNAVETIINSTGYLAGNDATYRQLTRAIQRAAQEHRVYKDLTDEQNRAIQAHIDLLVAMGESEDEAARKARELLGIRKEQTEAEKKQNAELAETAGLTKERAESAKAAMQAMWDGVDLSTPAGIEEATAKIQILGDAGLVTGEQVESGLKKIDAAANKLVAEPLKNLDLTIKQMRTGFEEAEQTAIDSFETIATSGYFSITEVGRAVEALKDEIKSPEAFEIFKAKFESWKQSAKGDTTEVEKAVKEMGEGIKGTAEQISADLTKAISSAGDQEALNEVRKKINELWASGKIDVDEYSRAMGEASKRQQELQAEVESGTDSIEELGDKAEETGEKLEQMGQQGADAGTQTESGMDRIGRAAAGVGAFYDGLTAKLKSMSEAALQYFYNLQSGTNRSVSDIEQLRTQIDRLGSAITALNRDPAGDFIGLSSWMTQTARQAAIAERAYLKQKLALEQIVDAYERGDYSSSVFRREVEKLRGQFDLLNDQDLSRLESAVSAVQNRVDSLTDSLTDTVASLEQELAALQGDTLKVEQLRYEEKKAELQDRLNEAKKIGDGEAIAAAQRALQLQQQTYDLRVKQTKEQQEEERRQAAEAAAEEERKRQQDEVNQREVQDQTNYANSQTTTKAIDTIPERVVRIELDLGNGEVASGYFDEENADAFLDRLEEVRAVTE